MAAERFRCVFAPDPGRRPEQTCVRRRGFEVVVSGQRKGTGSSRETAPQCERWSGVHLVVAASFAPIHERNNINLGQLMGTYEQLARLQKGLRLGGQPLNRNQAHERR
jgi:3-isopropylmalate dehydratase small subunit